MITSKEVIPGTGQIDYRTCVTELARIPNDVPLMIEHLETAAEHKQDAGYIRTVCREDGAGFY